MELENVKTADIKIRYCVPTQNLPVQNKLTLSTKNRHNKKQALHS